MSKQVPKRKSTKKTPPELDVTSESFDPAKALAADSICLPFPNAKVYNNVAEYYSHTFITKEDRQPNRPKEQIRERNFAWYYSTLGYDPSYGNEYYADLHRTRHKVLRRKGKKPASTNTFVSDNMRSTKVVQLKSKYKLYCQRKFKKRRDESSSDVWTSGECAKEFVNKHSGTVDLETRQQKDFLDPNDESNSCSDDDSGLISALRKNRNVIVKFNESRDPLKFLKCILFGKVDDPNFLRSENSLNSTSTSQLKSPNPLVFTCQNVTSTVGTKPCIEQNTENNTSHFFKRCSVKNLNSAKTDCQQKDQYTLELNNQNTASKVDSNYVHCMERYTEKRTSQFPNIDCSDNDFNSAKTDNHPESENTLESTRQNIALNVYTDDPFAIETRNDSSYETESSGYRSDYSDKDGPPKFKIRTASSKQNLNLMGKTIQSKQSNSPGTSKSKDTSQSNNDGASSKRFSTRRLVVENGLKDSSKQSVDKKPAKPESSKSKNISPKGCVCSFKKSEDVIAECSCGFYKKALNEIRKFKIPRKKRSPNGADKKKRKCVL